MFSIELICSVDLIKADYVSLPPSSSCDSCSPLYNELRLCLSAQRNDFELQLKRPHLLQTLRLIVEDDDSVSNVMLNTSQSVFHEVEPRSLRATVRNKDGLTL